MFPNVVGLLVRLNVPPVDPVKSRLAPILGISEVIVPEVSPLMDTLSCGNGTLLVQFAEFDQTSVVFPDQV